MEYSAQMIADYLKGEVEGDGKTMIRGFGKIEEARQGELTFLSNPAYTKYVYTTQASAILVNRDFVLEKQVKPVLIRVDNAYEALAKLLTLVEQSKPKPAGIHSLAFLEENVHTGKDIYVGPFAYIGKNVKIGDKVHIYPHVYIGDNVTIGDETIIYPGARIYQDTLIGKKCILHAGCVIGSDGFGFAPTGSNYEKIPQIGIVELEDHVEIGSNTTIDRATMGHTLIKKGVKLDNLIQIGHNVEIGENTVMAAQTGIAGSAKIGKDCMFGGQVGISGHLQVADGVKIAAKTGVPGTVKKENIILEGIPSMPIRQFQRSVFYIKQLPEMYQKIRELENKMKGLSHKKED